jgi:hypothetical protein
MLSNMGIETKTAIEAIALLEAVLQKRNARFDASVKPIQFELGNETWSFDPTRKERFEKTAVKNAALTIECTPEMLGRLISEPTFYLKAGEKLRLTGDRKALKPLVKALGG